MIRLRADATDTGYGLAAVTTGLPLVTTGLTTPSRG
ncbi:hypothetical protein M2271_002508 [Streptomyces sp. LBL]|nr:hypothetical protein [Streptomyces sp. LBL]